MPKRFCLGCRQLFSADSTGTLRCPACQATTTAARNQRTSTTARGYGTQHQRERARWQAVIDAGNGTCHAGHCLEATRDIQPGAPWDLGHLKDRTGWRGPEHRRCNRATSTGR